MSAEKSAARADRGLRGVRAAMACALTVSLVMLGAVAVLAHGNRGSSGTTAAPLAPVAATATTGPAQPTTAPTDPLEPVDPTEAVTVVQANLNKDYSVAKFDADLARVFAQAPDIITFNEVYARDDLKLAPAGYDMFRTPGPRTGWAPVVWREAAWSLVEGGTYKISSRPKKFKSGMVGVRYANWVTLIDAAGRTVSVISAHIAPNDKDTAHLLVPSLKRLGALAQSLQSRGPVILGGDLNMGYRSSRYAPGYLARAGLQSSYDLLGTSFVTHRRGGTIDYFFLGSPSEVTILEHYPVLLASDHRMLVGRFHLTGQPTRPAVPAVSFRPGRIKSNPRGSKQRRMAVRSVQVRAIKATQPGQAIHVASDRIWGRGLIGALSRAHDRGVNVTVITARRKLSKPELALRAKLGRNHRSTRYFVQKRGVWTNTSRRPQRARGGRLDPTMLLISRAGATPAFGMVANSNLSRAPLRVRYRRPTVARVTTDAATYDRAYRRYLAAIGRSY